MLLLGKRLTSFDDITKKFQMQRLNALAA